MISWACKCAGTCQSCVNRTNHKYNYRIPPHEYPISLTSVAQKLEAAAHVSEYYRQNPAVENLQPPYLARISELQALVALTPGQAIELELLLKKRWT